MSSSASEAKDTAGEGLGGARADFVASLGRKVADARGTLSAIEGDPSSPEARGELRRRLHALGTGAKLLRFESMALSIQEGLAVLDRGALAGRLDGDDLALLAQLLDDLPALVWGDAPPGDGPGHVDDRADAFVRLPVSALVVGEGALADALIDDDGGRAFECERTDDVSRARDLARAFAPDVILLDGDLAGADDLAASLLEDPLTEPVPIVVVGTFRAPEDAARFVALGVARSLPKPASGHAVRGACNEVLDARDDRTVRVTLGEPTLEQLAERLSQELKGALIDGADPAARSIRVPLGEGTEVLGALWGAIARVQEVVGRKTGGAIRFAGGAPEGAIALAPWLHHDLPGADRAAIRGRGAAADVRLDGRRAVVADDDPGVTWFISDLLRTAGCEVHEALDGLAARDLAFHVQPDLVVSDILMPGLDGFALSRALKRDVALRDTPVILLSWKEDLLQRVRELGASAAAYMRKESDSRAILARVREVLRPRARIEARLRADGEVRGRLDDLSPRLLLDLVCSIRKDARVAVRDATCLYEIEIRDGAPRLAQRTATDGAYQSGEAALARLLGAGAGRFVIASNADPVEVEMSGTLSDLLARPLAAARGALEATTGARVMEVDRILLDPAVLDEHLAATPDPARALLRQLAQGASPRRMVIDGAVPPRLLEDVLSDMAARCAVRAVIAEDGTDLLGPAVEAALATLTKPARQPSVRPTAPVPAPAPKADQPRSAPRIAESVRPPPRPVFPEGGLVLSEPPPAPPAPPAPTPAPANDEEDAPSSLEDAVMREISDRSPEPGLVQAGSPEPPPLIEPGDLRPRSSNPPASEHAARTGDDRALPPIVPDAIVPAAASSDEVERPADPRPAAAAGEPTPREPWGFVVVAFALLVGAVAAVLHVAACDGAPSSPAPPGHEVRVERGPASSLGVEVRAGKTTRATPPPPP